MSEMEDLLHALKNWKEKEQKVVSDVLQRLSAQSQLSSSVAQNALQGVTVFHKQITKEEGISNTWFDFCKNLKKKLKLLTEKEEKKQESPNLKRKPSEMEVKYPEVLLHNRSEASQRVLKCLYRNFLVNYEEAAQNTQTCTFLLKLLAEVRELFENKSETEENKRINSICMHLGREGSRCSKEQMLKGEISVKQVTEDDEDIYVDEEAKAWLQKIQREQFQANQMGFYNDMKRNINKNAHQECRYCSHNSAYCEDQKQIRAADEPMTRFMRCNNCGKAWRD